MDLPNYRQQAELIESDFVYTRVYLALRAQARAFRALCPEHVSDFSWRRGVGWMLVRVGLSVLTALPNAERQIAADFPQALKDALEEYRKGEGVGL